MLFYGGKNIIIMKINVNNDKYDDGTMMKTTTMMVMRVVVI